MTKRLGFTAVLFAIAAASSFAAAKNFRVVASTTDPWRPKGQYDWVLQINDQPRGSLTLGRGVTEIEIDAAQRERLLDAARTQRFFDLPKQLGEAALDVPTRSLTIVNENKKHTVVYYDPGPLAELDEAALEDLAGLPRFLAVWATLRSFIGNPRAADERKEDRRLVEELTALRANR